LPSDTALAQAINNRRPGESITLTIQRGGQELTVSATLAERPA
jgi:S1-C subfamily serine protease